MYLLFLLINTSWALEGFFQPEQVELLSEELELSDIRISTELLQNRNGALLQSVVSLDHCSGVFVSSNGLLLTNKHCLQLDKDTIEQHSNPKTPQDEYLLPNTTVYLLDTYRDITSEIDPRQNSVKVSNKNKEKILRRCKGKCKIIQGINGSSYLLQHSVYHDVRGCLYSTINNCYV